MKTSSSTCVAFRALRTLTYVCSLVMAAGSLRAASITMTNSDAAGATSFNTKGNWNSTTAPATGNDYLTSTNVLRTPTSGSATFAANNLTINGGGTLAFKTPGPITVPNLILNGGTVAQFSVGVTPDTCVLAGAINALAPSTLDGNSAGRILLISSPITNTARLTVTSVGTANGIVALTNNNTSYAANWTINANGVLQLGVNGAMGAPGSGAITNNGTLTFSRSDSPTFANLILGSGSISNAGAGTVTLSNNTNSYSGNTTVAAGTLKLGGAAVLGSTNGVVTMTGGTLDLNGNSIIKGAINGGSGTITSTAGTPTYTVRMAGGNTAARMRGPISISTVYPGSGNNWQIFSGDNDYTGSTTVGVGSTFSAQHANALGGTGSGTTVNGNLEYKTAANTTFAAEPVTVNSGASIVINTGNAGAGASLVETLTGSINLASGTANFNFGIDAGKNATLRLAGVVSGAGNLAKNNGGILSLAAVHTYTGNTLVNAGSLLMEPTGSNARSPLVLVASGAIFDATALAAGYLIPAGQAIAGAGAAKGIVTAGANSGVLPGGDGVAGTLTFTNGPLNLNDGAILGFDLSSTTTAVGSANDLLQAQDLVIAGNVQVNFAFFDGKPVIPGTYTIIKFSGTMIGGAANLVATGTRYTATFDDTVPGEIRVTFSGAGANMVWAGDGASNRWDIALSPNWRNGGQPDVFRNGDSVVFNDSGAVNNVVNLAQGVAPSILTVSSTSNYIFSGNGLIAGGVVVKEGPGTLIMSNANTYSGGTFVTEGIVKVGNVSALGANGTTITATNTGSIDVGSIDQSVKGYTYVVSGAGPDGQGAIRNTSATTLDGTKSGVKNLIMLGDTTLGTINNRFDIGSGGYVNGNNFKFTKVGSWHLPFRGPVSNISEYVVLGGRLYGEAPTQNQISTIARVYPGASLGAYCNDSLTNGITNSAEIFLYGGSLGAEGSQSANNPYAIWTGPVNVMTDSLLNPAQANANAIVRLTGGLFGSAGLTVLGNAGQRPVDLQVPNPGYTGNWIINANGWVRLFDAGTLGSGSVIDNGILDLWQTNAATWANNITGTGWVRVRNTNGVTFDGSGTVTVGSGTDGGLEVGRDNYGKAIFADGAKINVTRLMLGNPSNVSGDVLQTGGEVTVTLGNANKNLGIGHWGGGFSTYRMQGGVLNVPNGNIDVGSDGGGQLLVSGGLITAKGIAVDGVGNTGAILGTNETFNLSGGVVMLGANGLTTTATDGGYRVNLSCGTLGALESWASSLMITLSNEPIATVLNSGDYQITLSGALSGPGGVSKTGRGLLVLGNNNVYAGDTTVNDGTLLVNGAIGTNVGSVIVAGGRLAGSGVVRSPVTVQAGATLTAGSLLGAGTLTISNSTTLSDGSALVFDLTNNVTVGGTANDLVDVKNDLTLNGTIPVSFNFLAGAPALGSPYTLAKYGGTITGGAANLAAQTHYGVSFDVSGGLVKATFAGGGSNLVWRGDGAANLWAQSAALNWWNGTALDFFGAGDLALFDDSGSNNVPVLVEGTVAPLSITVNSTKDYVFGGNGRIAGAGSLVKQGTGTLTVTNANDYMGATVIQGGTLAINSDASLGAIPTATTPGKVQLNNARLLALDNLAVHADRGFNIGPSTGTGAGTIEVPEGKTMLYAGVMTNNAAGTGTLVKSGAGTLELRGLNSHSAGTRVQGGILALNTGGAAGAVRNQLVVESGALVLSLATDTLGYTAGTVVTNLVLNGGSLIHAKAANLTIFLNTIEMTGGTLSATNTSGRLDFGSSTKVNTYASPNASFIAGTSINLRQNNNVFTVEDGEAENDLAITAPIIYNSGEASAAGITKNGTGRLWLNATANYPGQTLINGGTLALGSNAVLTGTTTIVPNNSGVFDVSQVSTGFVLTSGQAIAGNGTVKGNVTIGNNSTVSPAGFAAPATLGFSNSLIFNSGGKYNVNLAATTTEGAGVNDLLNVAGDLVLNGPATITLFQLEGQLATGTYRLINYGGSLMGNPTNFVFVNNTATTRYVYTIDTSVAGQINLVVSGSPESLVWTGSGTSVIWDLTTTNWTKGGSPDRFFNADDVLFNDSTPYTSINLSSTMAPGSVAVDTAARLYSISGGGKITGGTGLTKTGTGLLFLGNNNDFLGPVSVTGGTLRLGNSNGLGATNGATTFASGTTLDLNGNGAVYEPVFVQGTGVDNAGAVVNGSATSLVNLGLRGLVTLTGDTLFGGQTRWDIITGSLVGNGFKLTKTNSIEIGINTPGQDTGLGDVDIVQGTLTFQGFTRLGDPAKTITISSNAVYNFWAIGNTIANPLVKRTMLLSGGIWNNNSGDAWQNGPVTLQGPAYIGGGGNLLGIMGPIDGPGSLIKNSALKLVLTGTNTFTGDTLVNSGTLILSNSAVLAGTPRILLASGTLMDVSAFTSGFNVQSNQMLAGSGTVTGLVVAPSGAIVSPGRDFVAGTLVFTNSLTLNGAILNVDLAGNVAVGGGTNDLVQVHDLTLSGTTLVRFNFLNGAPALGVNYTLLRYSGTKNGSIADLTVANESGYTAILSEAAGVIQVSFTGSSLALTWAGDGAANLWDLNAAQTWLNGGAAAGFRQFDSVSFTDAGSVSPAVSLSGVLQPASLLVNANTDYTFAGSGGLAGNMSLTKSGSGTLTLDTLNAHFGKTIVTGGTLRLGSESALGANPGVFTADQLTLNGGSLRAAANAALDDANRGILIGSNGGTIAVDSGATLVLYTPITGAGGSHLAKQGAGTLVLGANNTVTNILSIDQGIVQVGGGYLSTAGTLGYQPFVTNNSQLVFDRSTAITITNRIAGLGQVTYQYSGPLGPQPPNFIVNAANLYSGTTVITNSRVTALTATALGSGLVSVQTNGQLHVNGVTITNPIEVIGFGSLDVAPHFRYGALRLQGGTISGPVTLLGPTRITAYQNSLGTISGPITGAYDIDFNADNGTAGTVTLSGTNDFASATLSSATVTMGSPFALPASSTLRMQGFSSSAGAVLNLNNSTQTVASLQGTHQFSPLSSIQGGGMLRVNSSADVYNGRIQANSIVSQIGSGTLTLGGNADNASGRAQVDNGTLILAKPSTAAIHTVAQGSGGTALFVNGGTVQLAGTGNDQVYFQSAVQITGGTFDFNGRNEGWQALIGTGGRVINSAAGTTSIFTIGENNGNSSYSGSLQDDAGSLVVVKVGTGNLALNGVNTLTGTLSVNEGGLTSVGTYAGPVYFANNTSLSPNGFASPATATFGSSLTLSNGARLNLNLTNNATVGAGVNDLIEIGGDLVLAGTATVTVYPLATELPPGTYRLINYGGSLVGGQTNLMVAFSVTGTRSTLSLDFDTPHQVNLVVGSSPSVLVWRGTTDNNWNLAVSPNWFNGTASDLFYNYDAVRFDDTRTFAGNINLPVTVTPLSVLVDASTDYTIAGSGRISGSTGITKNGPGVFSLGSTGNDYTGPILVNAGVLKAGATNSFGVSSKITVLNGGQIDFNGINLGRQYTFQIEGMGPDGRGALINTAAASLHQNLAPVRDISLTGNAGVWSSINQVWDFYNGTFNGNGFKLVKNGPGRLDLWCNVINVDEMIINEGLLYPEGGDNRLATNVTVNPNGTLGLFSTQSHRARVVLNGGSMVGIGNATLATILNGPVILASNSFMGDFYVYSAGATTTHLQLNDEVSGPGSLTKLNTNTVFLAGTNTYTGETIIQGGRIALLATASISNSPSITLGAAGSLQATNFPVFYLAPTQTLAGSGTVIGAVADSTGASIQPGGPGTFGTLTLNSNLTLTGGGVLVFDLNTVTTEGVGTNDLLSVGRTLTLAGATEIKVNPTRGAFNASAYTLINYAGALVGDTNLLTVSTDLRGATATLDFSVTNKIRVSVTGGAGTDLLWVGDYMNNFLVAGWNIGLDAWWTKNNGVETDIFRAGDSVKFDDFSMSPTVELAGSLYPGNMLFEQDQPFIITGPGRIVGNGTLTRTGAGTLILANQGINAYNGSTDIRSGAIQVGDGGFYGSLPSSTITNNGTLILNRADSFTLSSPLEGAGIVQKLGPGILTLAGNSPNFAGNFAINNGVLKPASTTTLGSILPGAAPIVANGGALDLNGLNLGAKPVNISGAGSDGLGAIINSGAQNLNALRFVNLAGDATVNVAANRWDIRANPDAALGSGGQPYKLTKTGSGFLALVNVGVDPALGDIDITGGTLEIAMGTNGAGLPFAQLAGNPLSNLIVRAGATLDLYQLSNVLDKVVVLAQGSTIYNNSGVNTQAGPVVLQGNATVNVSANTLVVTNTISGQGLLTKIGNGPLQIGSYGPGGALNVPISITAGSLVFLQGNSLLHTQNISGVGTLMHNPGAGMLTLSGTNALAYLLPQSTNFASPMVLANGSVTYVSTDLQVGRDYPYGRLIIDNGASLTVANNFFLGDGSSRTGEVTQLGGWVNPRSGFRVGHWPSETSSYTLEGGSLVLTGTTAATNENPGMLCLGVDGTGVFTQRGGLASAFGILLDNRSDTPGVDTFTLEGGTFFVGPYGINSGTANANTSYAIYLGGGTLASSNHWGSPLAMTLTGTNGDTTIDTGFFTNTLSGAISGTGGLVKQGAGTLVLSGGNSYLGATRVGSGTLLMNGVLNLGAGAITVSNGATLGGSGTIAAPVEIQQGAALAPGNSIGRLWINDALTLAGTTAIEINRSAPTLNSDRVSGITTLTCGGTLNVTLSGPTPRHGDTFDLFDAATTVGTFSAVNLPTLPANVYWDVSQLYVDGTIRVYSIVPAILGVTPASQAVECSSNATFTVTASGAAPLSYQWFAGSTPISGANGAALTLPSISLTDAGSYSVIVTNGSGAVTSAPVILTVEDHQAPIFVSSPTDLLVALGNNCTPLAPDVLPLLLVSDCSSITITQMPPAGVMLPSLVSPVMVVAVDANGNAATTTVMVTGTGLPALARNNEETTRANETLTVTTARLVADDVHPEGRSMSVTGVSETSTNGGTVVFDGASISYMPVTNFSGVDAFTYTNTDCAGFSSVALVIVTVQPDVTPSMVSITAQTMGVDQVLTVIAAGVPGRSYLLQQATELRVTNTVWTTLTTLQTSTNAASGTNVGQLIYLQTNPPSPVFFRTRSANE